MNVRAVVVTFNRKRQLVRCLDALLAQSVPVQSIVIVDNGSTDGTAELLHEGAYLEQPTITLERRERNTGGAGGFSHGVAVGRTAPADWLWLMDDDVEPNPDALERLLAVAATIGPDAACLCPTVVGPDGLVQGNHRGRFRGRPRSLPDDAYRSRSPVPLEFTSFVGPLVSARAARALDPPRADFFIWCEDYEYSFRLREQGEILLVPDSVVRHANTALHSSNARTRFWNRVLSPLLGWELASAPEHSFWRNLFGLRNYVWLKRRYEEQSALGSAGVVAQFALRSLLCDERPLRRLPWVVRFGLAGWRGQFHNVPPARWSDSGPGGRA
jgi:rhamnopyranosyl-N-acetylglucosaminyl-diphospho-decaprenol beta-1,3/1,4-galactofuranosyltransferase